MFVFLRASAYADVIFFLPFLGLLNVSNFFFQVFFEGYFFTRPLKS